MLGLASGTGLGFKVSPYANGPSKNITVGLSLLKRDMAGVFLSCVLPSVTPDAFSGALLTTVIDRS